MMAIIIFKDFMIPLTIFDTCGRSNMLPIITHTFKDKLHIEHSITIGRKINKIATIPKAPMLDLSKFT